MPNAVMKAKSERRRPFIGDQLDECRDASGLYYILPVQKVGIPCSKQLLLTLKAPDIRVI